MHTDRFNRDQGMRGAPAFPRPVHPRESKTCSRDRGRSTFGLDGAVRMHSVRQCPGVYVVSVPNHLSALGVRKL